MTHRLKDHVFIGSVIAAIASMVVLFAIFSSLWFEVRVIRDSADENTTWAAASTQIDFLKFTSSLKSFAVDPNPGALFDAQLNYELILSRLDIVTSGSVGDRLRLVKGGEEVIAELQSAMKAIEDEVKSLDASNAARAFEIAIDLEERRALLNEVLVDISNQSAERQAGFRDQFSELLMQAIASLALLTLLAAFIGIMLIKEHGRRLEADARKDAALKTEERANRAKTEFLSLMSHELRTPLNAILGFAQLLQANQKTPLNKQQQKAVTRILQGGKHLLTLINDVLDLSKIEAGREEIEIADIDLNDLVEESLEFMRTMAARHSVTATFTVPERQYTVSGDYLRLKQVLLNLLANAIKYNRTNGFVEVWIDMADDNRVAVHIRDTGRGIAEEDQPELFKPFTRFGMDEGEIEGTGIGLTLSKRMVEMMKGEILFESTPNVGSVFWIELPGRVKELPSQNNVQAKDVVSVRSFAKHKAANMKFKILYVEDTPANIALMEDIIADLENTALSTAHNAELGLEMAEVIQPDVILMDINLPGMNGVEALKRVRDRKGLQATPVVAITGDARSSSVDAGLRAGFYAYLTKPLIIDELIAVIDELRSHPNLKTVKLNG